jgi:two-component system response regulator DesR
MISVVVVDDQAMVRQALAAVIDLEPDIRVVGQAGDAAAALELVARSRPDVVVLDVQLSASAQPGADGLTCAGRIRELAAGTRVLVVTTFARPGYLARAMAAGADGFLVKDSPADELIRGIRAVHAGRRVIDPRVAVVSAEVGPNPLTGRELQVLAAAATGATTGQIARRLHLAQGTVRNTLSTAMQKVDAGTRAEAVRIATERGWLC